MLLIGGCVVYKEKKFFKYPATQEEFKFIFMHF